MNNFTGERIIDREGALARLGGDEGLLRDLIRFFLEDSPELLQCLRQNLDQENPAEVERAAHSLKGLAANFGAEQAVKAAFKLEQIGHSGKLADAPEALVKLEQELERLTNVLR